jgi:hypothetical protein
VGMTPLRNWYPELFLIARNRDAMMEYYMDVYTGSIQWNQSFLRVVQVWELESMESFLDDLYAVKVHPREEDRMIWSLSKNQGLHCKHLLQGFEKKRVGRGMMQTSHRAYMVRQSCTLCGFCLDLWTVAKILTRDNLRKQGIILLIGVVCVNLLGSLWIIFFLSLRGS